MINSKYIPSIYAKNELPTLNEISEYYMEKCYYYTKNLQEHQELDPYWKIPRRKYLNAIICNQFNKMIFEDGYREELLEFINKNIVTINGSAIDVRFICDHSLNPFNIENDITIDPEELMKNINKEFNEFCRKYKVGSTEAPPIYTIPLPSGKENPFITDYERININELDCDISLSAEIKILIPDVKSVPIMDESFIVYSVNLLNATLFEFQNKKGYHNIYSDTNKIVHDWGLILGFMLKILFSKA